MSDVDPMKNPTDSKVERLRERGLDLLAGAAEHAQRIEDIAQKLGLTPDLVDGLGDTLYNAAVTQLDLASKILERSQVIVDRLLDLAAPRQELSRFERVEARAGHPTRIVIVARNASDVAARVSVSIESEISNVRSQVGRTELRGHSETAIEITLPPTLEPDRVYAVLVTVILRHGECVTQLPVREYEIWVRA